MRRAGLFFIMAMIMTMTGCGGAPVRYSSEHKVEQDAPIIELMVKVAYDKMIQARDEYTKQDRINTTSPTKVCGEPFSQADARWNYHLKKDPHYPADERVLLSDSAIQPFREKLIQLTKKNLLVTYEVSTKRDNYDGKGRVNGYTSRDILWLGTGDVYFTIAIDTSSHTRMTKYNALNRFTLSACGKFIRNSKNEVQMVGNVNAKPNDEQIQEMHEAAQRQTDNNEIWRKKFDAFAQKDRATDKENERVFWGNLNKNVEESFAVTPEQKQALAEKRNREASERARILQYKVDRDNQLNKQGAEKGDKLNEYVWYAMGNGYIYDYEGNLKVVKNGKPYDYARGEKVKVMNSNPDTGEREEVYYEESIIVHVTAKDKPKAQSYFIARPVMKHVRYSRDPDTKRLLDDKLAKHSLEFFYEDWTKSGLIDEYRESISKSYTVLNWF